MNDQCKCCWILYGLIILLFIAVGTLFTLQITSAGGGAYGGTVPSGDLLNWIVSEDAWVQDMRGWEDDESQLICDMYSALKEANPDLPVVDVREFCGTGTDPDEPPDKRCDWGTC